MRIVLYGYIFGLGGIQTHLIQLATGLADKGHEVFIISTKMSEEDVIIPKQLLRENVSVISLAKTDGLVSWTNNYLSAAKKIRSYSPDFYYLVGISWLGTILSLIAPKRTLCVFHEVMSGVTITTKDPRWLVSFLFDEVIGQTNTVASNFQRHFRWKKRLSALPALPDPLERSGYLVDAEDRVVDVGAGRAVYFGRVAPHKGCVWLARNISKLEQVLASLDFYGEGPDGIELQDEISRSKSKVKLTYHGSYPAGAGYVDLLSSYDVILLPTFGAEGAPLVLLEAMACGVPFVATDAGGIRDYSQDNPNVMVTSATHSAFLDGVVSFMKRMASGEISQSTLQSHYQTTYSNTVLLKLWDEYFRETR